MFDDLQKRVTGRLSELEAKGARRILKPPAGIDLSSNDYLGLANHRFIKERMAEAVLNGGCGSTASRLLRGHRAGFASIENRFAEFKGTEAALYFGSGYAANLGMLTTFLEPEDVVFSDEMNHASLIDGLRLARARRVIFPHCDVKAVAKLLTENGSNGQRFLVTESLFSMDGDRAPLAEYAEICRSTNCALLVDEAHAVGIYGARGSGLIEEAGIDSEVFLSINTAGKALGVCGAFAAGPGWAIEYLIQRARTFIFSTAPPPALTAALEAALTAISDEPDRRHRLAELTDHLHKILVEKGICPPGSHSQIIPVIIGDNDRAVSVAASLQEQGFDVRAIRPPTVPEGTARLRISVNANLDPDTLSRFAEVLADVLQKNGEKNDSAGVRLQGLR